MCTAYCRLSSAIKCPKKSNETRCLDSLFNIMVIYNMLWRTAHENYLFYICLFIRLTRGKIKKHRFFIEKGHALAWLVHFLDFPTWFKFTPQSGSHCSRVSQYQREKNFLWWYDGRQGSVAHFKQHCPWAQDLDSRLALEVRWVTVYLKLHFSHLWGEDLGWDAPLRPILFTHYFIKKIKMQKDQ